jgi:hypothetical protein
MGLAPLEGIAVNWFLFTFMLLKPPGVDGAGDDRPTVIVVTGAEGTPEYGREFATWSGRWETAAEKGGARFLGFGCEPAGDLSDRDRLRQTLADAENGSEHELWLVLIGHGTFDGREAKFNLRGPDVSATGLAAWLAPIQRPVAVINCASSSGPFLQALAAPGRVVITATKSGYEQNFTRFGDALSRAITDPAADFDKDGQTSLLEAYLAASRQTQETYRLEGRLATEQALLDDNGDAVGTRADLFRGLRPAHEPIRNAISDGSRAHQWHLVRNFDEADSSPAFRKQRDALELAVIQLRDQKEGLNPADYRRQFESLLLELAKLYERSRD